MISVIVPTKDRPGPLNRALRGLARQTMSDIEVIVVNDGGASPAALLDAWHPELNIRLVDLPATRGAAFARNRGLESAERPLVAFLDDDDVYLPHHLAQAVECTRDTGADLVYAGALVSLAWIEAMPRMWKQLPRKDYVFDEQVLDVTNMIHTSAVVIANPARRSPTSPARFDTALSHCEDWDFWLRLRRDHGYTFAYTGRITSIYHQVPHRQGLVADGYRRTPSAFTLARARLYDRYPTQNPRVAAHRDWFRGFDAGIDALVEAQIPLPPDAFEHALRHAHQTLSAGLEPDYSWLNHFLGSHGHGLHDQRPMDQARSAPGTSP